MSNFIDKLSNKIQGNDNEETSQNRRGQSGNTRSGQGTGRESQQYSTQSGGFDDDYNTSNMQSNKGQSNMGQSNMGYGQGSANADTQWKEHNLGADRQSQQQQSSELTGSRGGDFDTQQQGMGGGRQTRSQGGMREEVEDMGRRGANKAQQEGDKYVQRNL